MEQAKADHASLVAAGQWLRPPWSTMQVLGRQSRETAHSRMLRWFLDPAGGHGLGDAVLRAFLDRLHVAYARRDLAAARARREVAVTTKHGNGSIDVLVEWAGGALLIENKVWASVHGEQLLKYAAAYPMATRVYLTPRGHAPTARERGETTWRCLSWSDHVLPDLNTVADEARSLDRSCPALEDYINALHKEMAT